MAAAYVTIVLVLHPLSTCFTFHTFLSTLFPDKQFVYALLRAVRNILVHSNNGDNGDTLSRRSLSPGLRQRAPFFLLLLLFFLFFFFFFFFLDDTTAQCGPLPPQWTYPSPDL